MQIATFTSGKFTQIGIDKPNKVKVIDSRLLFYDPYKFRDRYLSLLATLFGIQRLTEDDSLIFSVSGILDEGKGKIIGSEVLNEISYTSQFGGFSFVKSLGDLVGNNNVHLFPTSTCIARQAMHKSSKKKVLPALSLYIDESIGVSVIKNSGIYSYESAIRPIEHLDNKSAYHLLCDRGIDDILFDSMDKVIEKYTSNLIEVIKDILARSIDDAFQLKQILIHSNKSEYILPLKITESFPELTFNFTLGNDTDKYLPIEGVFRHFKAVNAFKPEGNFSKSAKWLAEKHIFEDKGFFKKAKRKGMGYLAKIPSVGTYFKEIGSYEYYAADGEKTSTLEGFSQFEDHWMEYKDVHFSGNYYEINHNDGTKMKVYLDDLKSIKDLYRYKI